MSMKECPNCGAIWSIGTEEYEWEHCDACGYPDHDEDEDEDDDDDCADDLAWYGDEDL